jgi:hypothetical protein
MKRRKTNLIPERPCRTAKKKAMQAVHRIYFTNDRFGKSHTSGSTPLYQASNAGNARVVSYLLDTGDDVARTNACGLTPLHVARNAEVAALLLGAGADRDALDVWDRSPLDLAIRLEHRDAAAFLAGAGARIFVSPGWIEPYPVMSQDMRRAILRSLSLCLATFLGGMHPRLGKDSPAALLVGFDFVYRFVCVRSLPDWFLAYDVKLPELL